MRNSTTINTPKRKSNFFVFWSRLFVSHLSSQISSFRSVGKLECGQLNFGNISFLQSPKLADHIIMHPNNSLFNEKIKMEKTCF